MQRLTTTRKCVAALVVAAAATVLVTPAHADLRGQTICDGRVPPHEAIVFTWVDGAPG